MTSPAQQHLIGLLAQAGPDRADVRQLIRALGRPTPRPAHLDALEGLIAEVGPELAALVVVEACQGGLGG